MKEEKEKEYYIRSLAKVFAEEAKDQYYWFDYSKFCELFAKMDFNASALEKKCETEKNGKTPSAKTIGRIMGYFDAEKERSSKGKKEMKDKQITIETAKAVGRALCNGNEYGLLIKIEPTNVLKKMHQAEDFWGTTDMDYVYRQMNLILYDLQISSFYWCKPGTQEEGYDYYDMKLQSIRSEIDVRFRHKNSERKKLYRLVDELEELIHSDDYPGTPERWIKANCKLRYFDCVFDFIENNPTLYERIQKGELKLENGVVISFRFYPTKEECKKRREYLNEMLDKSVKQNTRYSMERLYQNELIEAFRTVFEADFS